MTILVNGKPETQISVLDRSVQYGDGLFETIALVNGLLHNWDKHYARLCLGAKKLDLEVPEEQLLLDDIIHLKDLNKTKNTERKRQIIKIILTRGSGGRGYAIPLEQNNQRIISSHAWPNYPPRYYSQGIDIAEIPFQLAKQGSLAGLKHLNRLEQILAKKELPSNYQEAIVLDYDGHIIEGISSNIYFVIDGVLCIPDLRHSGIAGTIRAQIIGLCKQLDIPLSISKYKIENILTATEIFFSNSIIGLWPVKSFQLIAQDKTQIIQPGSIYQRLGTQINKQLFNFLPTET